MTGTRRASPRRLIHRAFVLQSLSRRGIGSGHRRPLVVRPRGGERSGCGPDQTDNDGRFINASGLDSWNDRAVCRVDHNPALHDIRSIDSA
jgi:hypothetical protein